MFIISVATAVSAVVKPFSLGWKLMAISGLLVSIN